MSSRPYVLLSTAVSLDGYIDDDGPDRLLLSGDEDLDRVDEVRAGMDAILVGANTIRSDDPRLLVRSQARRQRRAASGKAADPAKVTITASGGVDPSANFFSTGEGERLVYASTGTVTVAHRHLGAVATVVDAGDPVDVHRVLADLADRGISRLLVEGGGGINTLFLTAGAVDELHIVYAPFFVGVSGAPRFVRPGRFPQDAAHRMTLVEARPIGDVVLLRYRP